VSVSVRIACVAAVAMFLGLACDGPSLEKDFFKQPFETRVERLRGYPLADQYRIFRYGNDKIEPPLIDLATPIAERGSVAVLFLVEQLKGTPDDVTVRDVLLTFDRMALMKSYDVAGDAELMATLRAKVAGIKDPEWKHLGESMIRSITEP